MDRLSRIAAVIAAALLVCAPPSAWAAHEEGDDGADEIPADSRRPPPSMDDLKRTYRVYAQDAGALPFTAPKLPDLSGYTTEAVLRKIDRSVPGDAVIAPLLSEPGFNSLTTAAGQGLRELALRQKGGLRAVMIEDGFVDFAQLTSTLPKDVLEQTAPGVYVLRLPLLVRHGATLQIGSKVKQLRLSQDRGALLASEGNVFIVGSEVIGWNEQRAAPAVFKDKHEFRPFIVGWGGSRTYIAKSRIAHLGYAATKSFGLSFSQYSTETVQRAVWPRPAGWVVDSQVEDLWYGFYCWEADDVVLRGNTFRNNIKYGIDPHDRSRRLIIAENDVSGTRQKHGIIISREVNESWIIHNKSHENRLSGIVLDRQCRDTVIAHNMTFKNGSDGIVISESSHNLVWSNLAVGNQHHGIRLRNSADVRIQDSSAVANGLAGIYGVARDLSGTDRDLKEDPYQKTLSMAVVGGQLSANGSGPINVDEPARIQLYGIDLRTPQRELGYRLGGALLAFQVDVLDILLRRKQVTVLETTLSGDRATARR
jgi:poly(beta-D-mannuronate) C5 epimerase